MCKLKNFIHLLLIAISFSSYGQISLSDINSAEIKSEEDLKKLGISQSEIDQMKEEFKSENTDKSEPQAKTIETQNPAPENELKIQTPTVEKKTSEIFGKEFFKNGLLNLKENSNRILPPNNYKLGSGDRLTITIWGMSEFNGEYTLDEFGNITPELVGRIGLKGKSFVDAKKIISQRFKNTYNFRASQIAINLTFSKVISVNIVGEVNIPGTYSVPSINSAFNLICLADGVTEKGSVRDIEIRRQGKVVGHLDLYQFLANPAKFSHHYLQDGDFIIVKPMQRIINISGKVNRPGKYESKKGESIINLLNIAGGLSSFADSSKINIVGLNNGKLTLKTFSFKDLLNTMEKVNSTYQINILGISKKVYGSISISGAINVPGKYEFVKGETFSQLLNRAGGLNSNSYTTKAQIIRIDENSEKSILSVEHFNNENNLTQIEEFDSIYIFKKNDFINEKNITVNGSVRNPGTFPYLKNLNIEDALTNSHGMTIDADKSKIQIERVQFTTNDSNKSYIRIIELSLPKDKDFELEPFDKILFRKLPEFKLQQSIEISGEVRYPGVYSLNGENETLVDLIERAGGTTDWAFLDGGKLYRSQDSLGLLLMNLNSALKKNSSKFNYILKPGDKITIPRAKDIVSISGAIGYKIINSSENTINSPFHKNRRATFYIKKYGGGYSDNARKNNVYVVGSNGVVKESIVFGWIKPKVKKGDKIIVNFKQKKKKREKRKDPIDWNRVIENTTIKITGILTILILANNAFTSN